MIEEKKMIYTQILLFTAPLILFLSVFHVPYVFDDRRAFASNADVRADTPWSEIFSNDFWGDPITSLGSHKSYRPLTILSVKVLYAILGNQEWVIFGVHAITLLCHSTVTSILFKILLLLKFSHLESLVASLLFALHPVHCESLAPSVGLADVTFSYCTTICLYIHLKYQDWIKVPMILVGASASVLFKELGIMTIPTILTIDVIQRMNMKKPIESFFTIIGKKQMILKILGSYVYLCAVMILRLWVMDFTIPLFHPQDNPAASMNSKVFSAINKFYYVNLHLWLLLCPIWLCFDWAMGCVKLITDLSDARVLVLVLALILLILLISSSFASEKRPKERRKVCLSLVLLFVPFVPCTNILVNVGFVVAERNLYLSTIGYSLLVAVGLKKIVKHLPERLKCLPFALTFLTMLTFSIKSFVRISDWHSERTLHASGLSVCPNNAKVHYNVAKILADDGRHEPAKAFYQHALSLTPDYEQALNNLGNIYRNQKDFEKAESLFKRAIKANSKFPAAKMNLGVVYTQTGKLSEAEILYKEALKLRPKYADCHYNLGNLYLKMKRYKDAMACFQSAISQNPNHYRAWSNLIILADELDENQFAMKWAQEALDKFPNKAEFYSHMASVKGKLGEFEEAEQFYLEAISLKPTSLYYGNLGVLYHKWKNYSKAWEFYEKALLLDNRNENIKANMAKLNKTQQQYNK